MGYTHYFHYPSRPTAGRKRTADYTLLKQHAQRLVVLAEGQYSDTAGGYSSADPICFERGGDYPTHTGNDFIRLNAAAPHDCEALVILSPAEQCAELATKRLDPESAIMFPTDFCKTNRMPYDICVVALLVLARHFRIIAGWHSDGEDGDLAPGIGLAGHLLNPRKPNPLYRHTFVAAA
jgi:hypothetical protein